MILVDTLVHPCDKPVDLVFPVASNCTFYKMGGLFLHSILWRRQFEGSQKIVSFFETVSNSTDLMNQIHHAEDAVLPRDRAINMLSIRAIHFFVDFALATLADQFIYGLSVWVPPNNVWFHSSQHVSFTKVPLKICERQRSCNTFQTFVLTPLIPLILMTKCQFRFRGT